MVLLGLPAQVRFAFHFERVPNKVGIFGVRKLSVTESAVKIKIKQESPFGISMGLEEVEFLIRMSGDHLFLVLRILRFLQQPAYTKRLQEDCDVPGLVGVGAIRIRISPLGQRLLAEPAHEVDHVLFGHIFHVGFPAILDERIHASAVCSDGLGV